MKDPVRSDSSARGDAEIIIAPDGSMVIFDCDAGLLPALEQLAPGHPRVRALRSALQSARPNAPEASW